MRLLVWTLLIAIVVSCQIEKTSSTQITPETASSINEEDLRKFIGNDFFLDDQHSYLGFKIKYFGFSPVRGRFDEFDGRLFYDPSNASSLSASVSIDVNSINTGNDTRDNDLKSEGSWFDMTNFPAMSFKSTKVMVNKDGTFDLIGDITIKGITLSDTISFDKPTAMSKDWAGNDQVDFSGRMEIDRQDYEVVGGDFWSTIMENGLTQLSDKVEIEIDMHCRKADYQFRFDGADALDLNRRVLLVIKENGIEEGIRSIMNLHKEGDLTAGKLSSIGYTLNAWGMQEQALIVFSKRLELFPSLNSTWNQLGITHLYMSKHQEARKCFLKALELDSEDSRAQEYLRLIERINASESS
ncbi:MAG: YceI family protein [Cyclobacteriaceae bacterium]